MHHSLKSHDDLAEASFRVMLFSRIVPNCEKPGLLDAGEGWLCQKLAELQIISFEHRVGTASEFEALDAVGGTDR